MILGFSLVHVVLIIYLPFLCESQRNEREEKICQPFLTSKYTSPLIENLTRSLRTDEEGEFSCELVLQDRYLPAQIRFTIHEGLYMLAVRHIAMGLQRQSTAAYHAKMLGTMLPSSFKYAYLSGLWSLDPAVSNPVFATESFRRALYGAAATDSSTSPDDKYSARVEYMKALAAIGNYSDAALETALVSKDVPLFDFHMWFLMRDVYQLHGASSASASAAASGNEVSPQCTLPDTSCGADLDWATFHAKDKDTNAFYQIVARLATNDYSGYRPSSLSWKPQVFPAMIGSHEFREFVHRREPFIISFNSLQSMSAGLGWGVHRWTNLTYLLKKVGEEEQVLVEKKVSSEKHSTTQNPFGLSSLVRRKQTTFHSFLLTEQAEANSTSYLNIQPRFFGDGRYRSPLNKLKEDLTPNITFLEDIWTNITDVNLWIGGCSPEQHPDLDSASQSSRFHFDATDNLYIVLEGSKTFSLLSPEHALDTQTVAPTYAVSPDGLPFQFNGNRFLEYYRRRNHSHATTASSLLRTEMLDDLVSRNVSFDTINNHFSTILNPEKEMEHVSTFTLHPGDMLYLPTGWFHRVVSTPSRSSTNDEGDDQEDEVFVQNASRYPHCARKHMALNFWWRAENWLEAENYEKAAAEKIFEQIFASQVKAASGRL